MLYYRLIADKPASRFVTIETLIPTAGRDSIEVQLPAWRPGRYELSNYAQNIRKWEVIDNHGNPIPYRKLSKDRWEINTNGATEVQVRYEYYANQLDAGASYFDENQLYVNPVNCLLYVPQWIERPCKLQLLIPADLWIEPYQIASALTFDENLIAEVPDYHTLADCPFIVSPYLQHEVYSVGEYVFHIWMQGECRPDWNRLKMDFHNFTSEQLEMFSELPIKEYHFLFQLPPYKFHHGVEHLASTVICLGPGYKLMNGEVYTDFLGVSSHELFHSWNVKAIRPAEMFPYDYSAENYTNLGYVAEGVTTYYGDLLLLRSKVYSWQQYALEWQTLLHRHFHVFGRYNQTLAESSFDTWLDGYKNGIPDRKVNMYVKGALVAFILDMEIRGGTANQLSLDDVLRDLYFRFAKQGRGYSEKDYLHLISQIAGDDFSSFFERFVWGLEPLEEGLEKAWNRVGCTMVLKENGLFGEGRLGIRLKEESKSCTIQQVVPGSPAETAGLSLGDEILAINGMQTERNNYEEWLHFFRGETKHFTIWRSRRLVELDILENESRYFLQYSIQKSSDAASGQKDNFSFWAKQSW